MKKKKKPRTEPSKPWGAAAIFHVDGPVVTQRRGMQVLPHNPMRFKNHVRALASLLVTNQYLPMRAVREFGGMRVKKLGKRKASVTCNRMTQNYIMAELRKISLE